MTKYIISKWTTMGELVCYSELVGYDWETGEEEFEDVYDITWNPHEEVIEEFTSYEEARVKYMKICEDFEESKRWPWNVSHVEFVHGSIISEYTDNEHSIKFILRQEES